ncbi:hypothetical protein [Magnetofaba australis]|uniref:Nitrogen regulatory protein P-II n=1 Tax=Magnetofaba australis IT-1 TaxID=1434232 RepID=A0A1Y2K1V2_9PROT|nr:hypothetical protein [Magnetofaba australis]OSM00301.1 hypothetical protein MAIT1_00789 [Magnetofaba australis IT-1]
MSNPAAANVLTGKLITAILPDDGHDKKLLKALKKEKGIITANSQAARGISILHEAPHKRDALPEAEAVRIVSIVAEVEQADALFDFIFDFAQIDRPGGGVLLLKPLSGFTPFLLPEGVADESADA